MNVLLHSTLGQSISTCCIYHSGSLLSFPLILVFLSRHSPPPPLPQAFSNKHSVSWLPMHRHKKRLIMVFFYFASRQVLFSVTLTGSYILWTINLKRDSTMFFQKNKTIRLKIMVKEESAILLLCPVVQTLCKITPNLD